MELTEQYGLFSKSQHQVCLKGYRIHGEVHSRRSKGGSCMKKVKKPTQEFRIVLTVIRIMMRRH